MQISKKDVEDPDDQSESNIIAALVSNFLPENISTKELEDNIVHSQQIQTPKISTEPHQTECSTVTQQDFHQLQPQRDQNLHTNTIQTHSENEVNLEEEKQRALQEFQELYVHKKPNTIPRQEPLQYQQLHCQQNSQLQENEQSPQNEQQYQNEQPYQNVQSHQNDHSPYNMQSQQGNLNIWEEQKQQTLQQFQHLQLHQNKPQQQYTQISPNILNQAEGVEFQQSRQLQQNEEPLQRRQPLQNTMQSQGSLLRWDEQRQHASQQFQHLQTHKSGYPNLIESQQGTQNFHEPHNPDARQRILHQLQVQRQHLQHLRQYCCPQMQQNRLPQYYLNTTRNSNRAPYNNIQNHYKQNYQPNTSGQSHTLHYPPQFPNLNPHPLQMEGQSQRVTTETQALVQMAFKRKLSPQMVCQRQQPTLNGQSPQIVRALQMPIVNGCSSQLIQQPPRHLIPPQSQINEHTSQIPCIPITSSQLIQLPTTQGNSSLVRTLQLKDQMPIEVPIADEKLPISVHSLQAPTSSCKKLQVVHPTRMSVQNGKRIYMMPTRQLPLTNRVPIIHPTQMFIPNGHFQQIAGSSQVYQQPPNQAMHFNNNLYNSTEDFENDQQPKRSRYHNEEQILELEKTFFSTEFPSKVDINKLSTNIGLSEKQIKSWFHNRRLKQKRDEDNTASENYRSTIQAKTDHIMNWLSEMKNHVDVETYYGINENINEDTVELPDSSQCDEGTGEENLTYHHQISLKIVCEL